MTANPRTTSAPDPIPFEDLCDFCFKVVEWIGNPDNGGRIQEFEGRVQPSCEFCEQLMRKLQQAVPEVESSGEIVPLRLIVCKRANSMQSDRG
jgi:predicted DCC family thiol-disulfide oxidoreductase YuxK